VLLRLRCDGVGHTVQIDAVFAQALAVIGEVPNRALIAASSFDRLDDLVNKKIRKKQRVVVGIYDALAIAGAKLARVASRGKFAKFARIAGVICRAVRALQV